MRLGHHSRLFCLVATLFFFVTGSIRGQGRTQAPPATNPAQQRFQAAQTFQIAEDLENAAAQYRASIAQALRQLGNLKVARQEVTEGAELLEQAVLMDGSNTDARVDLAIARFQMGQQDAASANIETALQQNPRDARALIFSGKLYFLQRKYEKAIERLQMALQIQPDFDIGYALALANLGLKRPLPAGVIFDEMLASSKPDAGMHVLIGIAYRENGYFDQAAVHFSKAIELDPRKRNAHAAFGITRYLQGAEHDAEANQLFLAELAASPGDYTSLYYLGLTAMRQKKASEAESWLEKAVAVQPTSSEANLALGEARLSNGDWEEAVAALKKSLQLSHTKQPNPETARIHEMLGQALEKLGRHYEAQAEFAESRKPESGSASADRNAGSVLDGTPNPGLGSFAELQRDLQTATRRQQPLGTQESAYAKSLRDLLGEAFHNLGVIDARASRFATATDEFAQASRWNAAIDKLDRNWGMAAFRAQRYDQAIPPLSRELQKNQNDAGLRQQLGLSYFMTDQFGKSAETLRPIIGELPDNPGLLYAAGAALVRSGDANAGRPLLLRMQQLGVNSAEAHVMIAQAYSDESHFSEALEELQRAEALNPKLADVHFGVGIVYVKQGKLEEAVQEFEKELSLNPESVSSKYQIAYIRMQWHQTQEAIPLLNQVLNQKPDYGDGHYQLGKALMETGDTNGAIQHLERSVELQPKQAYGYYQLSLAYRRAGRGNEADKALQTFQHLKAGSPTKSDGGRISN